MPQGISVIIPNFNGQELLSRNLPTVIQSLQGISPSEIIVVDDASTDDSVQFLTHHYPQVIVIRNPHNRGFGASVNEGVTHARFDLVLLLNSDVQPDDNYIRSSIKFFEKEDTFGVMGAIRDGDSGKVMEGVKYPLIKISGLKYKDIRGVSIERCPDSTYTFYLCGGNALLDKDKYLKLGGMLEVYHPFYQEDVDLSVRAWLSGWKSYYNSEASCSHQTSSTIKRYFSKEYISSVSKRNRLIISHLYLRGFDRAAFKLITRLKSWYYFIQFKVNGKSVYPGYREYYSLKDSLDRYISGASSNNTIRPLVRQIQRNIWKNLKA